VGGSVLQPLELPDARDIEVDDEARRRDAEGGVFREEYAAGAEERRREEAVLEANARAARAGGGPVVDREDPPPEDDESRRRGDEGAAFGAEVAAAAEERRREELVAIRRNAQPPPPPPPPPPRASSSSQWSGHPHPVVECRTTQGNFAIEVRPDWAPLGAQRYLQLVESGFFTNNVFYRVPERSHPIVQFGLSPNVRLRREFATVIPDDPPVWERVPVRRGTLAFAGSPGPPSRSCHMWFAIEGKSYMGHDSWEPTVGVILGDGATVLDRIKPTIGISVGSIESDPTFETAFPGKYLAGKSVEWFHGCHIAWDPWIERKKYQPAPQLCPRRRNCEYTDAITKHVLFGCVVDNCAKHDTLELAKAKCDTIEACGGVVQNAPGHFEIRAGTDGAQPSPHETAWVKNGPLEHVRAS
jgi:cyclophilin family peptidyl-prolyl cis-trans isomerase